MTDNPTVQDLLNPQKTRDPDRTRDLAAAVAEAVRCLNYATAPWVNWPGLDCAADVYDLVGRLSTATYGLDQMLRQTTEYLAQEAQAGRLEVPAGQPTAAVAAANDHLAEARKLALALADTLDRVQQTTADMSTGNNEEEP